LIDAWEQGRDLVCRDAPHLIVVHTVKDWAFGSEDCANALTFLELYAAVLGIGTCWGGYLYGAANLHSPLREALAIPPHHRVCGAMMVGYPTYHYHRLPARNRPRITWR
jgi:nitroreductase